MKLLKLLVVVFAVLYPSALTEADMVFFHYPREIMRGCGYAYVQVSSGGEIIIIEIEIEERREGIE